MTKNKIAKIFGWGIIFVIIFFTHSAHLYNNDEGVILDGAWNLFNNRHLYLDYFDFIPPGSFYLIFGVWKIFGVSFWSANIVSIIIAFGSTIGIYLSAQTIKKSYYNILAPLIFSIVNSSLWIINHNSYNLFFTIWAIYFLLLAIDKKRLKYFLLSGLMTGLGIMFLQQRGLALGAALMLFLLIYYSREWKKWLSFGIGALLPLLTLLFWPLKLIYYNLITFPLSNYTEANKISPIRLIVAFTILILFIYFLRKNKDKKVCLLIITTFCLLLTTIPLPDGYHIIIAVIPILSLSGLIIEEIAIKKDILKRFLYYPILTLILIIFLSNAFFHYIFFSKPLFYKEKNRAFEIAMAKCPGKYIYSGPFSPEIYFEMRKLNPTPYPFLVSSQNTPDQFTKAVESLKIYQPSCAVLYYPSSIDRFKHDKNNAVESYIRENYELIYSNETNFLYKLKPL